MKEQKEKAEIWMCLMYWEVNKLTSGNWSSQHYVKIAATNTTDKYPLSINEKKLTNTSVHGPYSNIIILV